MNGLDRNTGKTSSGADHLAQSIADILSTPIGTRVRRRDYGSLLSELIDAPLNAVTRLRFFAATAQALGRWEPRLALTRIAIGPGNAAGSLDIALEGHRTDLPPANSFTRLTIPLRLVSNHLAPTI